MSEVRLVPALRFTGYEDEWECHKLSELTDVFDGTHQTPRYTDNGVMFLSVENIDTLQSNKYISEGDYKEEFKVYPEKGDVLMTRIGDVGTTNIYKSNNPVAYYVSLALLKKKRLNSLYLKEVIASESVQKDLWHRTLHIAFPKKINKNEIEKITIPHPVGRGEQEKIGKLFDEINNLIVFHQQKLDKLDVVKKSMLEKMFPREGSVTPEIRFKGYTDDWGKCELKDILEERKTLQKISTEAPILAFASGQGVIDRSQRKSNNRDHLTHDQDNKIYKLTEVDDIVYNPANLKYGAIDRNKFKRGVISPIYVTFTTNEIPAFIELIVKSDKFKQKALRFEEGTVVKRQSVKSENLLTIDVTIAKSKDEQKRIGELFNNFDKLIILQQNKIEKLMKFKKALLSKMFI